MAKVQKVTHASCFIYEASYVKFLLVSATGEVPTSGWTAGRLSPRFYALPPGDGIWDFDFLGDPPTGVVLDVVLPIQAENIMAAPDWVRGVRIHAASNEVVVEADHSKETKLGNIHQPFKLIGGHVLVQQEVASYDDSFQPTGTIHWDGFTPHVEMKKLHHTLVLTVQGPDEGQIRNCIAQATAAGAIAAIIAAYATGGIALGAAISAFISSLTGCLGNTYNVRVDDNSYWVYWDT